MKVKVVRGRKDDWNRGDRTEIELRRRRYEDTEEGRTARQRMQSI